MRQFLSAAVAAFALCFLAAASSAAEYKWDGSRFVDASEVEAVKPSKQLVTIPPGYHAHTRTDGSVFIHGNENVGNAEAHAGVERPWPKTGVAGDAVIVDSGSLTLTSSPCPNGVCPVGRRVSSTSVSTVSTSATTTYRASRKGLLATIADNIRERRASRGRLFGGCGCR